MFNALLDFVLNMKQPSSVSNRVACFIAKSKNKMVLVRRIFMPWKLAPYP